MMFLWNGRKSHVLDMPEVLLCREFNLRIRARPTNDDMQCVLKTKMQEIARARSTMADHHQ